ncbi:MULTISPECIES: acyltransferase [unclassified Escherichia]|uniref:acyltransferase family protein n=1 Tax=unclassified Escherichia TaxID=2608889 RepID=UPI0013EEB117|nr:MULTISPECIES: acyltransferase [unclassified Escherichia]
MMYFDNLVLITIFTICIVVASFVFNSAEINTSNNRNITIDGFRGLLAPMVLLHHFVLTYNWKAEGTWAVNSLFVGNLGSIPVSLFFMITGYLFVGKISKGVRSWPELAAGRIFRIYPLYILMLAIIYSVYFVTYDGETSLSSLVKSLAAGMAFFLQPLNGYNIGRSISGVQWTLFYEALFYISLPLLSLIIKKGGSSKIYGALSAVVLILCLYATSVRYELFILFAIGGIAYYVTKLKINFLKSNTCSIFAIIICAIAFTQTPSYSLYQMLLVGMLFILISSGNDIFGALRKNGLVYLGDISYSIYLTHGFILYSAFTVFNIYDFYGVTRTEFYALFPMILFVTVIASIITYKMVETPFIKTGKNLSATLLKKNTTTI